MFLALYTGVQTWWGDLKLRAREEGGATAVEYALMVALIAAVIIVAVQASGQQRQLTSSTRLAPPSLVASRFHRIERPSPAAHSRVRGE